ncbi:MAG: hypothetical protein OXC00_04110 [Acidimicrobiaceae bacterium]|nr:hypothetical protein [Acidimicrobiaceae bacterium]
MRNLLLSVLIGLAVLLLLVLISAALGNVGVVEFWVIVAVSCAAAYVADRRLARRVRDG